MSASEGRDAFAEVGERDPRGELGTDWSGDVIGVALDLEITSGGTSGDAITSDMADI